MKNKSYKKEIEAIFGERYMSRYEQMGNHLDFRLQGGATFEQLSQLSKLLGTKSINFRGTGYDEYFGEGEAEISCDYIQIK